jgi:hypothetical protein
LAPFTADDDSVKRQVLGAQCPVLADDVIRLEPQAAINESARLRVGATPFGLRGGSLMSLPRSITAGADELFEDVRHGGDACGGAVAGHCGCEMGAGAPHGGEGLVERYVVGKAGDRSPGR